MNGFPFTEIPNLFSMSTGVVVDDQIICYEAWNVGSKNIDRVVGSCLNHNLSEGGYN